MPPMPTANIEVTYLVPSISFEDGGWVIVWVNGHPVLKHNPPPPPDDIRNILNSVLTAASLQRFASLTEKPGLEPQLMKAADAILSAYSVEIKGMLPKLNPNLKDVHVPELRYIALKLFGSDGGGIGILPSGEIVHIPGWTPEMLIPIVAAVQHLAEVTKKETLKPVLKKIGEAILEAYKPELKRIAEEQHAPELAHA